MPRYRKTKNVKNRKILTTVIAALLIISMLITLIIDKEYKISNFKLQQSENESRSMLSYTERLISDGFSEKEIIDGMMLIENLLYELKEIANENQITSTEVIMDSLSDKEIDYKKYTALLAEINVDEALYILLKLKEDFGSLEQALNEYLYSIQAGINLVDYVDDVKTYQKLKNNMSTALDLQIPITTFEISTKMLEIIQKHNTNQYVYSFDNVNNNLNAEEYYSDSVNELDNKLLSNIKPINPLENINNEVKKVK